MSASLFRIVLGAEFDRLALVLQRHYDLLPGQAVVVQGEMTTWNRLAWARRLVPFMPIPAERVPVVVHNRGLEDRGQVCYEWRREFRYPGATVVSYTLTRPASTGAGAGHDARQCVLDTFNQPPNIGITLALEVSADGQSLRQITRGPQFAIRGARMLAIPRPLHIHSVAVERALDAHTIHTEVTVSHGLLGRLFGYSGRLTVS